MRVLVTGATGFVGRWLVRDLKAAGHEAIEAPPSSALDISDADAVAALIAGVQPDAIAHLAGMAYAGDARKEPAKVLRVNVGGTVAVLEAAARQRTRPALLVSGSSEVYGAPRPEELPMDEGTPLRARLPYGLSKLAQEAVAVELALQHGMPVVVTRSFNHIGPGQRTDFVVPALASRIATARRTGARAIPIGNVDVRRDFLDVRDVVRAYRLLLEWRRSDAEGPPTVVNVASGSAVSIRWIAESLMRHAGYTVDLAVDPSLVRPDDAPEIRGDSGRLSALTGWRPTWELDATLAEVMATAEVMRG